jgi:hypothetical protein
MCPRHCRTARTRCSQTPALIEPAARRSSGTAAFRVKGGVREPAAQRHAACIVLWCMILRVYAGQLVVLEGCACRGHVHCVCVSGAVVQALS